MIGLLYLIYLVYLSLVMCTSISTVILNPSKPSRNSLKSRPSLKRFLLCVFYLKSCQKTEIFGFSLGFALCRRLLWCGCLQHEPPGGVQHWALCQHAHACTHTHVYTRANTRHTGSLPSTYLNF